MGGGTPQDPNRALYSTHLDYWHWQYKALGSYELPYGVVCRNSAEGGFPANCDHLTVRISISTT